MSYSLNKFPWWRTFLLNLNPQGWRTAQSSDGGYSGLGPAAHSKAQQCTLSFMTGPACYNNMYNSINGEQSWYFGSTSLTYIMTNGRVYGNTFKFGDDKDMQHPWPAHGEVAARLGDRHKGKKLKQEAWALQFMLMQFMWYYDDWMTDEMFRSWEVADENALGKGPWYEGFIKTFRFWDEDKAPDDKKTDSVWSELYMNWPKDGYYDIFGISESDSFKTAVNAVFLIDPQLKTQFGWNTPYEQMVGSWTYIAKLVALNVKEEFLDVSASEVPDSVLYMYSLHNVYQQLLEKDTAAFENLKIELATSGNWVEAAHSEELQAMRVQQASGDTSHWNAKRLMDVVFGEFDWASSDGATLFGDRRKKLKELWEKYNIGLEGMEVDQTYADPAIWRDTLYEKALKICKKGMWINRSQKLNDRVYYANIGSSEGEGGKWTNYDPWFRMRSGTPWLWSDNFQKGNKAFYMGYSVYGVGENNSHYYCNSKDGKTDVWSGKPWVILHETAAAIKKPLSAAGRAVGYSGGPVDKSVFKYTFKDGLHWGAYGGKRPWLWSGTDAGVGVWGEVTQCEGEKINIPANPADVLSEEYFAGSELPDVTTKEWPAHEQNELTFFKMTTAQLDRFKNYRTVERFVMRHANKIWNDSSPGGPPAGSDWAEYAHWAKSWCNDYIYMALGADLVKEDGSEAQGLLGELYKNYKKELAKEEAIEDFDERRTAEEVFNEATTYGAYSLALTLLTIYRDEIVFELFDEFVEKLIDDGSVSKSHMDEVFEDFDSTLESEIDAAAEAAKAAGAEEDLTDEEIEERQIFYRQCFLLTKMHELSHNYRLDMLNKITNDPPAGKANIHSKGNEFNGRIRLIDVEDSEEKDDIMNRLTSPKGDDVAALMNARPELISAMVPQIRLFKVFADDGDLLREIEFDFPRHMNHDESQYRANFSGVRNTHEFGIKDFAFKFEGQNPATARNDIVCDLTLFFRDFNDLIQKRKMNEFTKGAGDTINSSAERALSDENNMFSYLDLILFPGSVHKHGNYDMPFDQRPSSYRIRADVGWTIRNDKQWSNLCSQSGTTSEKMRIALEKINKSFYLNMVDHDLDFAADGSVTIKIQYRAYIESMSKSPAMDVMATPEVAKVKETIQDEINNMWNAGCSAEQMRNLLNTYKSIEKELLKKSYQSIMSRLARRQRLFYVYAPITAREEFAKYGFFKTTPQIFSEQGNGTAVASTTPTQNNLNSAAEDSDNIVTDTFTILDGELKSFKPATLGYNQDQGYDLINFFYIGDLFHTLMDCMYKAPEEGTNAIVGPMKNDVKNTQLLLSTFEYYDVLSETFRELNISDVPVAVDFFTEFMNKNVLEGERKAYPLMDFIRDILNKLLVELMNELCIKAPKSENKLRFQTANILASPKEGNNPVDVIPRFEKHPWRNVTAAYRQGILPFNTSLEGSGIDEAHNVLVAYPVTNNLQTTKTGMRKEDEDEGIRHLFIGRPRGLVKTIKFSKVDMQYIREARYFNHGYNGLMQLGAVYTATIEMVGNTLFYPGMTVFIDPISLGGEGMDPRQKTGHGKNGDEPSLANALGIGGYHLITKVKSKISGGKFTTTVEAMFYYNGDGNNAHIVSNTRTDPTEEKDKRQDEKDLENLQKTHGDEGKPFCDSIIKIRQAHAQDVLNPAYQVVAKDETSYDDMKQGIIKEKKERAAHIKDKKLDYQKKQAEANYEEVLKEVEAERPPTIGQSVRGLNNSMANLYNTLASGQQQKEKQAAQAGATGPTGDITASDKTDDEQDVQEP